MNVASFALFLLIGTARGAGTPCETFTDCTALKTAILDPGNNGNVNVCVSSTPIVCDETKAKNPIYLNDDVSMTSFQLNCVCNKLECEEEERCVLDYTPTSAYDGSKAYGGFILQDQRTLTVDGFDFVNLRGKGRLFYNQHGSTLTIRNSVFQNNVYTGLDGKNPIIVYDYTTSGPTSTTIENSLFQGNQGSLLGFQAGSATLKNNIFYDNSLPSGYESAFTDTSFIFWKNITDTTFVLQGNQFHSFQAPASSEVDDKFFMISATDSSKSVSTDALLANVTGNCAANNDVAGNYTNSGLIPNGSILDCNNGVYTAGAWPYRECRLLEGPECPLDYGPTGPPKPTIPTYAIDADRVYFSIAVDDDTAKSLDLVPNAASNHLVDQLAPPADLFPFDGTDTRSHTVHASVPPVYYSDTDSGCNPPTGADDPDSTWSGNGCVCFETDPHPGVSYYDMLDQTDASNPATGYRTAFDTSVTGGVTIAGWFKAGNTTGAPWYAKDGHPGQQTSLIFVRGEKSSWKAGYNLGMGNWNGWRFEVILKGPSNTRYSLAVQSPTNSYPGIDVWHYVVGTYDAEKGRASIYVDNQLVGTKTVGIAFDREARDIQWSFESENAKTRIGNGYDYNDKNFHGCTGGIKVYGGAVQVSDTPFTSVPSLVPPEPTEGDADASPTFILPECYDGPEMVVKDSSDITMCEYHDNMIEIVDMSTEQVMIKVNDVWANPDPNPEMMRIFVHNNGIDSILQQNAGDGFQCLNDDGYNAVIGGEEPLAVQCFQASKENQDLWLAVIDVVITDEIICGTNDVPHPCDPDGEPILESCSWRIIIPCEQVAVCPTGNPTEGDADDIFLTPCPDDLLVLKHIGTKEYPNDAVTIVSQDQETVTVKINQAYSEREVSHFYYQYQEHQFDNKCYEEQDWDVDESIEITIQCTVSNEIALLELWVADPTFTSGEDDATIPKCCDPTVPEDVPVTKYLLEIKCVSECPAFAE